MIDRTKEIYNTQTGYIEDLTFKEFVEMEADRGNDRDAAEYVWSEI